MINLSYQPSTLVEGESMKTGVITSVDYLGPRYVRERYGDFTDTTLSGRLGAMAANSLLLFPANISDILVEPSDTDKNITLRKIPELEKGRTNNRSGVEFGQLHITDQHDAAIAELVALKHMHRLTAPREFHAAQMINKRYGSQVTYSPIGFVRSPKGGDMFGYLTHYEHGVTTLDNILWNETSTPEQRERAMAFAAMWLVSLHNIGIVHGDAQAKNIAYDSSQKPRYVDLEGAHEATRGELNATVHKLNDIHDLFNPVYMPPSSPDEQAIFVDTYLEQQDKSNHPLNGLDILDVIDSAEHQR